MATGTRQSNGGCYPTDQTELPAMSALFQLGLQKELLEAITWTVQKLCARPSRRNLGATIREGLGKNPIRHHRRRRRRESDRQRWHGQSSGFMPELPRAIGFKCQVLCRVRL